MSSEKMYCIRNLEELRNESENYNTLEYELSVDSDFVGESIHGPYEIIIWEFGLFREGESRRLILRIKEAESLTTLSPITESSKNKYYHGGGIAEEIVAFSSLFFRRRVKLIQCVRENDMPMILPMKQRRFLDKDLVYSQTDLSTLSNWFNLIEELDESYHQKIVLAARLYHRSILMIEEDPDLAYLTLISAIEALCQDHPLKEKPTLSQTNPKLDNEIDALNIDESIKNKLKDRILERNPFLSRKFVTFILDNIDDEFWKYDNRSMYGQIKPEDLPKYLKNIYDQRSKTLHEGQPFPPVICYDSNEEICCGLSLTHRGKKWMLRDYIPSICFFERLVNYVIKNFIKTHQTAEPADRNIT